MTFSILRAGNGSEDSDSIVLASHNSDKYLDQMSHKDNGSAEIQYRGTLPIMF